MPLTESTMLTTRRLQDELQKKKRNLDRHDARLRTRGITNAGSPEAAGDSSDVAATPDAATGKGKGKKKVTGQTARKCANCGMVGHIKTNKRSVETFHCRTCEYLNTRLGDLRKEAPIKKTDKKAPSSSKNKKTTKVAFQESSGAGQD